MFVLPVFDFVFESVSVNADGGHDKTVELGRYELDIRKIDYGEMVCSVSQIFGTAQKSVRSFAAVRPPGQSEDVGAVSADGRHTSVESVKAAYRPRADSS